MGFEQLPSDPKLSHGFIRDMKLRLILSALGILIGLLIGTLPMSLGYSAGRGWINPPFMFAWPLLIPVASVLSGVILLLLAGKGGWKSAGLAILAMLGVTVVSAIGAWASCMNCFMTGFQHNVEGRITSAAFQNWAETTGRRIAADTNIVRSSNMLPNGLATMFPHRPTLLAQDDDGDSAGDFRIMAVWGGGHWHWALIYRSSETNQPTVSERPKMNLGNGVSLSSD